jgi:hypothetical protein
MDEGDDARGNAVKQTAQMEQHIIKPGVRFRCNQQSADQLPDSLAERTYASRSLLSNGPNGIKMPSYRCGSSPWLSALSIPAVCR